jgi:hypothetical protein
VAVSPPLADKKTMDGYFDLVVSNSLVEAYYFAQKQQESTHRLLFERLVVSVHQEKPTHTRAEKAALLVGLPLTAQEDSWLEECLLHGAASKLPGAKDSLMARRIAVGRFASENSSLQRLKGDKIAGVNWDNVRAGIAGAAPH